jgi:hypothetical protein
VHALRSDSQPAVSLRSPPATIWHASGVRGGGRAGHPEPAEPETRIREFQ